MPPVIGPQLLSYCGIDDDHDALPFSLRSVGVPDSTKARTAETIVS